MLDETAAELPGFRGRPFAPSSINLDWRHASHWGSRSAACRECGLKTRLRDDAGLPMHKVCAEWALQADAELAAART